MVRITRTVLRGAFAAGVIGALGIGAMQTAAKPAEAAVRACTSQLMTQCADWCRARGYATGTCYPGPNTQCYCFQP